MKAKLIAFFKQALVMNILLLMVLSLIVWFVAPMIHVGHTQPFASDSVKGLLISGIFAVAGLKLLLGQLQVHGIALFPLILEKVKSLGPSLHGFWQTLWVGISQASNKTRVKLAAKKQQFIVSKQPWFLVLGEQQSGKKSMIAHADLYFKDPKVYGQEAQNYINQFPDYEWWFTEHGVMIDIVNYDPDTDMSAWRKFIKILKKQRRHRPVNGIVLTFSLPDLLLYTNQKRHDFLQNMSVYIRDIHKSFSAKVPVYIIFTKADLISGFMGSFNDLSKEETLQTWGVTFPIETCDDADHVRQHFHKEYKNIITRLQNRVLWSLDTERTAKGREHIFCFPQQMSLFEAPIESFVQELFGATRYTHALQLRGVYFTSAEQVGQPYDFLKQAVAKKFDLSMPDSSPTARVGESYFIQKLFFNIIFKESKLLGFSQRDRKLKRLGYLTVKICSPALALLLSFGMYQGYQTNKKALAEIDQQLALYHHASHFISTTNPSLATIIPSLNTLQAADNIMRKHMHYSQQLLPLSYHIRDQVSSSLARSVKSLYLPRIAAQLEYKLRGKIDNQNLLYAAFKGYLAFGPAVDADNSSILAPIEYLWAHKYRDNQRHKQLLNHYLKIGLQQNLTKLPLDVSLVRQVREQLSEIIPSQRAFGLLMLKGSVSTVPDLIIRSQVGPDFSQLFSIDKHYDYIPALYTAAGFNKIYLAHSDDIVAQVAKDNQQIGLARHSQTNTSTEQIKNQLNVLYAQKYFQFWTDMLAHTHIKKCDVLNDQINQLRLATAANSPLRKLLLIVANNTAPLSDNGINVQHRFENLDAYATDPAVKISNKAVMENLIALRHKLENIQQASNQNLAALQYLQQYYRNSDAKDPIKLLTQQENIAPQPVKRWLTKIINQSWFVLQKKASVEINNAWQTKVMAYYNNNLAQRYPLSTQQDAQVSIESFGQFFGYHGILDQFFKNYISAFVDTSSEHWHLKDLASHKFELLSAKLTLFKQLANIKKNYFPNNNQQPKIDYTLRARTLDRHASSTTISLGNHSLTYSHGPERTLHLSWPMNDSNQNAMLNIVNFSGEHASKSYHGPWALFRLFDDHATRRTEKHDYVFYFSIRGMQASFNVGSSINHDIFNLNNFRQLHFAQHLIKV